MSLVVPALIKARSTGARFYFTGIPCRNGHIAMRQVSSRACVLCRPLYEKKSYEKHRRKRIEKTIRWRENNPEAVATYSEKNKKANCEAVKRWNRRNRSKINAYRQARATRDQAFRLRLNLSNRLGQAVKSKGSLKSARTTELVGCSIPDLCAHIERQFLPGMTWNNYGYGADRWHVDHIIPCSSFDLDTPEAQRACFHFSNLQPLWQTDNQRKGGRR